MIDLFAESLELGPGAPGRATLYTGARGSGKTVMLNEVADQARKLGWLVISETATPGLLKRIVSEHLPRMLAEHDPNGARRRFSGFTVPGGFGSASWSTNDKHQPVPGLRGQSTDLLEILADHQTGLLLTIDEIHRHTAGDLEEICATIQHLFREQREVAFVAAGLPASVHDLLAGDRVITFLRRADRHHLGKVAITEVAEALRKPVRDNGRDYTDAALRLAAEATKGYPYLIQLVGFQTWRQNPTRSFIDKADVEKGANAAQRRLGNLVHEPSLADLSAVDRSFLVAMAAADGPSKTRDVAERMGVNVNYANQYRRRLIDAEVIEAAGHGSIDFAVPYLREFLRTHAAADTLHE